MAVATMTESSPAQVSDSTDAVSSPSAPLSSPTISGRLDVAVLDVDGPPGVAFIRSLGSRGVFVDAYSHLPHPAGRYSRHVRNFHSSPSPFEPDAYVEWLAGEMSSGRIGLVAPTSDYTAFAVAAAMDMAGIAPHPGIPTSDTAWQCLHKGEFGALMESVGFASIPYRLPTSLDRALAAGEELGYPVMLKPRSHVGVGLHRGSVVNDAAGMRASFEALELGAGSDIALERDPDLMWPMVQKFISTDRLDVVSVAGCLDADGNVMSAGLCRKMAQWPPEIGIGTLFESLESALFLDQALDAVRVALGTGVFEIEVCVDRSTGESFPIDLNPRAYGQITLEMERGNDLPALWYEVATGVKLLAEPPRGELPEVWQAGLTHYSGAVMNLALGPDRRRTARELAEVLRRPRVGSMLSRRDPLPALALVAHMLRHPGGLVRPYVAARRAGRAAEQ